MLHWLKYPFVRLTPAFAAGIVLFEIFKKPNDNIYFLGLTGAFFLVLFFIARSRKFFSLNPVAGFAMLMFMTCAGILVSSLHYDLNKPDHFSFRKYSHYQGVVTSWPEKKERYTRVILKVNSVKDKVWKKAKGKVQIYLPPSGEGTKQISYGTTLIIKGQASATRPPRNPMEFDYQTYLARKNIFHQHFLQADFYLVSGSETPNELIKLAFELRTKAEDIFVTKIQNDRSRKLSKAMILGIKTGMDEEMKQAYSKAGALHILAISGLHVGILYGVLALFMAPLRKDKKGKWVFTVVIISVLCGYALVVGMSPSVMRAVVMFSLITIGQAFYRTANIYNIIAFSAFLLLLFDPFQLFAVGFQLSYMAVIGIVVLYRPINGWFYFSNPILSRIWSISAVGIAAQVLTFPLALHYFHNFPHLFFLSNLLVIPSAFIILLSGFAMLIFSFLHFEILVKWMAAILEVTSEIMNKGVFFIESLPYSNSTGIFLSDKQTLLLYLVIISLLVFILEKNVNWFYAFVVFVISTFAAIGVDQILKKDEDKLVVYEITGQTAIDFFQNGKFSYFTTAGQQSHINYQVNNYRIAHAGNVRGSSKSFRTIPQLGAKLFIQHGKSILLLDRHPSNEKQAPNALDFDLIIIGNNSVSDFSRLSYLNSDIIILDGSNGYFYSIKAEEELAKMGREVYNTKISGGVEIDLKKL